jgi:acyl carrier protein
VPEAKDLWSAMVEALKAQSLDLPDVLTHATRIEDLNADSLDLIEILMTIEENLGLPTAFFDEHDFCGLDTLGEAEIALAAAFVRNPRVM